MSDYDFDDAARFICAAVQFGNDAWRKDPKVREHFRRAGALLLEAYPQVSHREWSRWLKKHFRITVSQAETYMALARPDP
jgi:hypothetical protein